MEMILILIALVAAAGVVIACFIYSAKAPDNGWDVAACIVGILGAIGVVFGLILYITMGWSWFASEYKADILNAEYGTNYSAKQVFFASDVIDTVRELDRKRVEVNGDLFRDEPDEPDGE